MIRVEKRKFKVGSNRHEKVGEIWPSRIVSGIILSFTCTEERMSVLTVFTSVK